MQVVFLDDSVQKSASRPEMGRLLAVGGILVPENELGPLARDVDEIARNAGIPDGCELKWSPPPDNWIRDNLVDADRGNCYRAVIQAALRRGAHAVVAVWDEGRTTLKGQRAFRKAFDFVYERVTFHLDREDQLGLLIADRPGGGKREEDELLEDFVATIESGTRYVVSGRIPINLLTTPSHLVRHLQLADLVVGITTAMVGGHEKYAAPLFPEVHGMLLPHPSGLVGGTGLKLFPEELTNLYHWVLGEDAYSRTFWAEAIALPDPAWPYYYGAMNPATGSSDWEDE